MEKREIVALLESLCDRPLGQGGASDPAQLQALCRDAADILARTQTDRLYTETVAETDRLTALLATVLSGRASEVERALLAEALAGSPACQLDASSAAAYLDAIEATAQPAPAELIGELLIGGASNKAGSSTIRAGLLSAMANGKWWAPNRLAVAAVAGVLLVAGGAWSLYWQQAISNQPVSTATNMPLPAAVATSPVPAAPALATAPRCEPQAPPVATGTESGGPPQRQAIEGSRADADCLSPPDSYVTRHPDDQDLAAARARAEAERAQAEAAAKVGATQTGGEPAAGASQADKAIPPFLEPEGQRPAAARAAPSHTGVR